MSELEKIPSKKNRWQEFQKNYNTSSKNLVQIIGANISIYVCMIIPILLIGFIWTDFGAPKIDVNLLSDGIVTVALFIIGQTMMMKIGATGGRYDTEYTESKKEFDTLYSKVNDIGTMFMFVFCEWQIDLEMQHAVATRLRYMRITKAEWEKSKDLPYRELVEKYGRKKARKIAKLKDLEPIELNEAILLFNNNNSFARGGVPISGDDYISKKSHSAKMILSALFAALLTISIAISLTSDISFSRVMYTVFKLVLLLCRMAEGYSTGAKAYNTIEVRQLQARNNYFRQYVRFVEDKTYLKLGDKYGDISCYINDSAEASTI